MRQLFQDSAFVARRQRDCAEALGHGAAFGNEIDGEDKDGKLKGSHRGTGIGRPRFWERAKYFNMEGDLARALDALEEGGK